MNKEFYYLYQYFEKEELFINITEFELQIQIHPSYPSLISITDTLNFFNIENCVFQIDLPKIEFLPNRFVAKLMDQYYLIEKKGEYYIYYSGKKIIKVSKKELESKWGGIVILIENSEIKQEIKPKKNKWFWVLPLSISVLLTVITILLEQNKRILFFLLPAIGFIFSISGLQKLLIEQKELKKLQLKSNQFMHNYQVFKNSLQASNMIQNNLTESATIQLGNKDASLKIIMIINPFSTFSKEAYSIVEEILHKYFEIVSFEIRFSFNKNDYSIKKSKKIHQQLVALYLEEGQKKFIKALHNWFEDQDENKLCQTPISSENELKINEILSAQFNSNLENNLIFTPEIIINQYLFPKQYDRKTLIHFIYELSEDEDIIN
ncbi:cysteine peptidase family C39 domain-containing protein [Flavobacterium sp. Root420]|uniref:cysteine peptidase family C39 domain-containing protein n=1 Tax=Flavobacterium sp. Root420 TaxID=1736533 RepID=UPI0006FA2E4D|nr:cysteine peptidase family C39 domain-containing protein [Flavobacterium sp. Root420]KQX10226.1 hypothetical protein ASC72_21325 [Flavobacterium sp. Root420]